MHEWELSILNWHVWLEISHKHGRSMDNFVTSAGKVDEKLELIVGAPSKDQRKMTWCLCLFHPSFDKIPFQSSILAFLHKVCNWPQNIPNSEWNFWWLLNRLFEPMYCATYQHKFNMCYPEAYPWIPQCILWGHGWQGAMFVMATIVTVMMTTDAKI